MGFIKEKRILLSFIIALTICIIFDINLIIALSFGLVIFVYYAISEGNDYKAVLKMCLSGFNSIKKTIFVFILIGIMTAFWRDAGSIASIIYYCSKFIVPKYFILLTFLLNCIVSFLIGTSFGTAATMGAVCVAIANSLDINLAMVGGAVLSGAFFGDRISFVSTSALFTADVTKTNIFDNVKLMYKTCIVPFIITCILYFVLGLKFIGDVNVSSDIVSYLSGEFKLSFICLLPALIIIILAIKKIDIKKIIIISILVAAIISLAYQKTSFNSLINIAIYGYQNDNYPLLNGGGALSMLKVMVIITISNLYSGIFNETKLLEPIKIIIDNIHHKCSTFLTLIIVSIIVSAIACNQMFAIALSYQLIKTLYIDNQELAIDLENSVVVIAPLIPWSIASLMPLTSSGAPIESIIFAFYLLVLPLYTLLTKKS